MRTASLGFANTITRSHTMVTRVDVLFDRQVILEGVALNTGSITWDRTAARLARLDATIADPLRVPVAADDILTPYGYELLVWRGVQLSTGAELLPLGVFPIQTSRVEDPVLLSTISACDRSQLVTDARFEDDYQIAAGVNYVDAIRTMIDAGVPDLEYLFPTTTLTTPLLTFAAQSDRWEAAQKMARSIGFELYFDGLGRCAMRAEPSFTTPVAYVSEGTNLIAATVSLDRATAYNRVVAVGRNASNPAVYRGVATDDDPSSPTFYDGPFGRKPRFFTSEFIASQAQADAAAASILAAELGVARALEFAAVVDPRLEPADVVQVTRSTLGLDSLHIIDALTIPLTADGRMTGVSRTYQVAS